MSGLTGFTIREQQATNWCWVAVAVSVDDFFTGGARRQCDLVQKVLAKTTVRPPANCCPKHPECDQLGFLDAALNQVERLLPPVTAVLAKSDLESQLKAQLPVCIGISWA